MRRNEPALDRLPEFTSYQDNGCDLSPSCLKCPLPRCRYDDPGWVLREQRTSRDVAILQMRARQALSVDELAERFGVSTRTVHRAINRTSQREYALAS
ncbi:MAG: helix-turn-helix domain-containing protein [Chloroflexi bacterium]|nr:helix-turn-helix domain-containing protein [Chloroflexota bacterium]